MPWRRSPEPDAAPHFVSLMRCHSLKRKNNFLLSLSGVKNETHHEPGGFNPPRTIDMGVRNGKRLERIPEKVVNEVLARLETILT